MNRPLRGAVHWFSAEKRGGRGSRDERVGSVPYTRGVLRRVPRTLVVAVVLMAGAGVGCSTGGDDDAVPSTTATPSEAPVADVTSTIAPSSNGVITIGEHRLELDISCVAPGAGEVLALGIGENGDGERVEAYVQAFVGEPYVGVEVGDTLYEAAFDGTLELFLQDDRIRASAIRFVTDLDLGTGEGTFAGVGSVEIECVAYDEELPEPSLG